MRVLTEKMTIFVSIVHGHGRNWGLQFSSKGYNWCVHVSPLIIVRRQNGNETAKNRCTCIIQGMAAVRSWLSLYNPSRTDQLRTAAIRPISKTITSSHCFGHIYVPRKKLLGPETSFICLLMDTRTPFFFPAGCPWRSSTPAPTSRKEKYKKEKKWEPSIGKSPKRAWERG
jgi:hypothetical protein